LHHSIHTVPPRPINVIGGLATDNTINRPDKNTPLFLAVSAGRSFRLSGILRICRDLQRLAIGCKFFAPPNGGGFVEMNAAI
jgi:hypothetical protein